MQVIHVVFGNTALGADYCEWAVAAYLDEGHAKAHAAKANDWLRQHGLYSPSETRTSRRDWSTPEHKNPYDPENHMDFHYDGEYTVQELPLYLHLDEYIDLTPSHLAWHEERPMSHWLLPLDLPYTEACEPTQVEDSVHVYVEALVKGKPYALVRFTLPACEFTLHGLGPKELAQLGQFLINTAGELKDEARQHKKQEGLCRSCDHKKEWHLGLVGKCGRHPCECLKYEVV